MVEKPYIYIVRIFGPYSVVVLYLDPLGMMRTPGSYMGLGPIILLLWGLGRLKSWENQSLKMQRTQIGDL